MAANINNNPYIMVVAIDLGTTYSGYAFAFITDLNDIKYYINRNWGEKYNYQSYKTPTSVLTGPNDEFLHFGYDAIDIYSKKIESEKKNFHLFQHFKMLLHNERVLNKETMVTSLAGREIPALNVFAYMIKALKDHCLYAIEKNHTQKPAEDMIRWVLTVPAIWRDTAKDFMREAALKAGLIQSKYSDQLVLALEPEAAGLYCKEHKVKAFGGGDKESNLKLTSGEKYLVIDAGGGTVDITGYQVLDGGKVKELIVANGGPWGGITVDKEYTELLKELLGDEFIEECEKLFPLELMNKFELQKKSVNEDEWMTIDISYSIASLLHEKVGKDIGSVIKERNMEEASFSNGKIILKEPYLFFKKTLEHIQSRIIQLLYEPSLRDLKYVMLVGGFGNCYFLQKAIDEAVPQNCTLIVPTEAQLTVLKGAVYFGFNVHQISSRIAKKTYGTDVSKKFIPGRHDEKRKAKHPTGEYCDNIFEPFVLKGQTVEYGKPIKEIERSPVSDQQTMATINLFCTDITDFQQLCYVDDPGIDKIGQVVVNLPDPKRNLNRKIKVRFSFDGTEIQVTAIDEASGEKAETNIDFSAL